VATAHQALADGERTEMAGGRVVIETVDLGGVIARRVSHAPGWRWSEHTAPEVGEPRCPRRHVGVMVGGRMRVADAHGNEFDAAKGDAVLIEPGHDAWTVGRWPAVLVEFEM
jgi:quercetin dioxygenase-like cupin family protein